jgi:hypothetical protein
MPCCLRIVPKSRSLAGEEEFRSQNSEVRTQVRASRGRYGLLNRSAHRAPPVTVLFEVCSMSRRLWAPDVGRSAPRAPPVTVLFGGCGMSRRLWAPDVGRSLTVTVLFEGCSMSRRLWAPDVGRFLWARLWRGARAVGTERTPLRPRDVDMNVDTARTNARATTGRLTGESGKSLTVARRGFIKHYVKDTSAGTGRNVMVFYCLAAFGQLCHTEISET